MADEIIGSVGIQIEADASDLQGQFDAAVAQAETAGANIAQGVGSGAAGFDSLTTAASGFMTVMTGLQALGVASAIEEIGTSSIEAYASIQKATIALGALTGSADQASTEIAGLKQLAQDDALSFPELLNANQRFTALGIAADQIPSALNAAANAAAAMNTSLTTTSNTMERIASSGTLSSRTLVQLGISMQDVATVMGVSSANVTKDFKAITDEGDRLDILVQAMQRLDGTAAAVADSISGSFNRLQNTLTFSFQQIGEAIAPAVRDLTDLATVAIPAAAQALISLSAPAVSIVELGKSIADARTQLVDFVASVVPFGPQIEAVGKAAHDSGQSFFELVPGSDAAKEGIDFLTTSVQAFTNTGPEIDTMTKLMQQNLTNLGTAAKLGGDAFRSAWNLSVIQAELGNVGNAIGTIVTAQEKANVTLATATTAFNQLNESLKANKPLADGHIATLGEVEQALKSLTAAQKTINDLNPVFAETLGGVTKAFNDEQSKISALQQTVLQLMNTQDGSIKKAEELAAAQSDLSKALDAVVKSAQAQVIPIQGTGEGYIYMGDQAEKLVQKQRDLTLSVQQAAAQVKVLNDQQDSSPEHARAVIDALTNWQTAIKNTGGDLDQLQTIVINGVLFTGKLPDIIKQAQDQLKQFGGTAVTVAQEWNQLGIDLDGSNAKVRTISDTLTGTITVIKGSDDALKQYHGTIVDGQVKINGYVDDTTKAIGYQKAFTGSVTDTGAAIGNTLTPNLNSAGSSLSNLSLEAEQAQKAMQALGTAAKTTGDEIDQAIGAMDNWDSHMGSADATGLGAWALAAQMTGETTFAGSGAAVNSQGQQVSALTELQAANQAAGNALAASLGLTTTATTAQTKATDTLTTSTTAATSSTAALNTSINNLSTSASNSSSVVSSTTDSVTGLTTVLGTAAPVVNFAAMSSTDLGTSIQSLNSQLLNAGVVVDGAGLSAVDYANKLQSTVDNMNASAAAVDTLSKASTSAASNIATAATVIAEAGQAVLQSATGSGPSSPSAALTSSLTALSAGATPTQSGGTNAIPVVLGTYFGPNGLNTITGTPGESLADALAAMFPGAGSGSFSMQSAIAQNPGVPFGANPSPGAGQTPIQVVMNYPQFNSQQQSQKTMNDVVTMLRTVPSLKL